MQGYQITLRMKKKQFIYEVTKHRPKKLVKVLICFFILYIL